MDQSLYASNSSRVPNYLTTDRCGIAYEPNATFGVDK